MDIVFDEPHTADKLSQEQKDILFSSFSELHPYLKKCYTMYHGCPKTKLTHFSIVFCFKDNVVIPELSDEFKTLWKFQAVTDVLNKKSNEMWMNGASIYFGIPDIRRVIPKSVMNLLFTDTSAYHLDGSSECYDVST